MKGYTPEFQMIRSFLTTTQELTKHGYKPCKRHLNIYPEDFTSTKIWEEVLQCLELDDCLGVTLSINGIKIEDEDE